MQYYLDFEKPVADLEDKIEELKRLADGKDMNITSEIKKLGKKAKELRADIFFEIDALAKNSHSTPSRKTLYTRLHKVPHGRFP